MSLFVAYIGEVHTVFFYCIFLSLSVEAADIFPIIVEINKY